MKKSYSNKLYLLALALLLAFSALSPAAAAEFWKTDTSWYDGPAAAKGTVDDPYRIADAEGLAGFAALVNAGSDDFKDKYVTLTLDVDLAKKEWIPIGWMVAYGNLRGFAGHFDGGAYDIDPTECSIVDPLALIKTSQKQSSSSGGCNGGFAVLALLAALPLLRRRGKK